MIVRILGDAQYDVPETALTELNTLDARLQRALEAADEQAFGRALTELIAAVRQAGEPVPDAALTASSLVLPGPDSRMAQVAALVSDEGLIPG